MENHMLFTVTDALKRMYPGAHAGVLAVNQVTNPAQHAGLEARKAALQDELRVEFSGQDRAAITALATIRAYAAYYKRFDKTYHVQLQLESIVFKGKAIPSVAALVEAMFMAEVKNMLLTAGHDLDKLQQPVRMDAADGSEGYTLLRGQAQTLKAGDMYIADGLGVISSILYGPDQRSQINPNTRRALFTVYAPEGISPLAVRQHLDDILANVRVFAPQAQVDVLEVY
jgi:DNA/RNA-binding domain of Phe-tRNA-synthetase-like protein